VGCASRAGRGLCGERPIEPLRPRRQHRARSVRGAATPPALLLAGVHNGDLEAVACPLLIEEVRDNPAKPYFRALLSELEAQEAVEAYSDLAVMLADPIDVEPVLRDSKEWS
jgi:hypothetical protein